MTNSSVITPVSDEVLAFWQCQAYWLRAANDAIADGDGEPARMRLYLPT